MLKVLAIARTIFLIFIVGFTLYAMPPFVYMPRTFDEQYSRCSNSLSGVTHAVWLAIAWIAFETVIGWLLARRRRAATASASSPL